MRSPRGSAKRPARPALRWPGWRAGRRGERFPAVVNLSAAVGTSDGRCGGHRPAGYIACRAGGAGERGLERSRPGTRGDRSGHRRVLRRRYQTELSSLNRPLINDSGQVGYRAGRGQLPPAVAGWAVSDRSVRVSVAAAVSDRSSGEIHLTAVNSGHLGGARVGPGHPSGRRPGGRVGVGRGAGLGAGGLQPPAHFSLFLGPDRTSEAVPPGGTARAATLDWAATPDARPVTGYQPAAPVRGTVPSRLECRPAPRPRAAGGVHRRPAQV